LQGYIVVALKKELKIGGGMDGIHRAAAFPKGTLQMIRPLLTDWDESAIAVAFILFVSVWHLI